MGVAFGVGLPPKLVPTGGTALTAVEVGVKSRFSGFLTSAGGRCGRVGPLRLGYVVGAGDGKKSRQVAACRNRRNGRKVGVKSAKSRFSTPCWGSK